jgi:molybdopterin converting factor small subunit
VRVTAYPPYRRMLEAESLDVDLPDGARVRDLLGWLGERHSPFRAFAAAPSDEFLWGQLIVHVNDEIAGLGTSLRSGDRIDLLPPIAGGSPVTGPARR